TYVISQVLALAATSTGWSPSRHRSSPALGLDWAWELPIDAGRAVTAAIANAKASAILVSMVFSLPSAGIPLPPWVAAVVAIVVLSRLTGIAVRLARGSSGGLAESRGGNEGSQGQGGDEGLHDTSPFCDDVSMSLTARLTPARVNSRTSRVRVE